jgi:hypothetical protein
MIGSAGTSFLALLVTENSVRAENAEVLIIREILVVSR